MALDTSFPVELLSRTQYGPDNSGFDAFLQGRKDRKEERRSKLEEQQATLNLLNISSQIQQRQVQNQWEIQDRALEMENRPKVANFLSNLAYGNFDQASESLKDASIPTSQLDEMTRALETARKNQEIEKLKRKQLEGQRVLAETLNKVDWADESSRQQVWKVGEQFPELMGDITTLYNSRSNAADLARWRSSGSAAIRNVNEIVRLEQSAEAERVKGNTAGYQGFMQQAQMIRDATSKGEELTGYSNEGTPIFKLTRGGGSSPATVGTQTGVQQRMIGYENSIEAIGDVLSKVRPEDVGVKGVLGEQVFDKWLSQVDPSLANQPRIANRTALRGLREQLFAAMSPERTSGSGFSNKDVDRIKELASGLEASTSYPDFQNRMTEIRNIITQRTRVNAEALGQPVPDFAKTPEELAADYERRRNALKQAVSNSVLTKEQAESQVRKAYEDLQGALMRYHRMPVGQ